MLPQLALPGTGPSVEQGMLCSICALASPGGCFKVKPRASLWPRGLQLQYPDPELKKLLEGVLK